MATEAFYLMTNKISMRRVGNLGELQSSALYLATCPAFMTGTELYIDGGQGIV